MRISISLLTIFVFGCDNTINTPQFTDKCPGDYLQWRSRGRQFHCDVKNNITYHCILNSEERLIETCLKREVRQQTEGCPWILNRDGNILFGASGADSTCPGNIEGCPPNNHGGYFTDTLYLYPKCLVPKSCRNCSCILYPSVSSTTQTTQGNIDTVFTETPAELEMHGNMEFSCATYQIFMVIFLVTTLPSIVCLILFVKKKRKKRGNGTSCDMENQPLVDEIQGGQDKETKDEGIRVCQKEPIIENDATRWLREKLNENAARKSFKPLFLYGINGSGKTTAARHCLEGKYYVINASEDRHIMKSLKGLADAYSVELDEESVQKAIKDISKKLGDTKLLINNVEKKNIIDIIDPFLQKVQCVVTTHNANLRHDHYPKQWFEVKGLSDIEARELFQRKDLRKVTLDEDFTELIGILKGSPMDILCVIRHMKVARVSIKYLLKKVKRNKPEGGKIFQPLDYFLSSITNAHPEIRDLVAALQFLSSECIPICLFVTLAAYGANKNSTKEFDSDFDDAESKANSFISDLQEVSFGEITGEDDHRKISVHPKVQYTVKKVSPCHEKRKLLLKLLKCMSWLFVKDHGHRIDHTRCMNLLPHAEEVIHHFLKQKDVSTEEAFVFVQVCDQVRYTYEVLGYHSNEKKYAEYMMCFVLDNILHEGEDYFKSKFQTGNIEEVAKEVWRKFLEMSFSNDASLSSLASEYIMYKVRCEHDKENLKCLVGETAISDASRLTGEGMKRLRENNLIVMEPSLLELIFTFEVMITALRAFGRFALVFENKGDMFQSYISLIKRLAIHEFQNENEALKSYKTIRSIGIDFIEIQAACEQPETFQDADYASFITNIQQLLDDETKYYKYGVFVQIPNDDLNHKLRCRFLILECLRIYKPQDTDELKSSAKEIRDLFGKNISCMEASHSQRVKQGLVKFYIDDGQFEEAINFLENYDHLNTSEETKGKIDVTSRYDCQDILLRCRCYHSLNKPGNVLDFLVKFDFKIPTEEVEARKLLNEIESIRNESEETALKS